MLTLTAAGLSPMSASATTPTKPEKEPSEDPATGRASLPTNGSEAQNDPAHEVHKFDIPAGTLAEVTEAIRKQTGIRIALDSENRMANVASPGVKGVVTLADALAQALADTGLAARFEMPDSVKIEMRANNESVVVTADSLPSLKYTAPLVDLPQTITVVSQETMQYTASTTLMEALRTVPGITFGAGEGGNPLGDRPFIRGLDSQSSTYIDGMRDIAAQSREVFDIDSIEVQEGPGGTYGGRGTGGGSINMNSKLARRDNFIAGSFMPGTAAYRRGTVDGNAKLGRLASGRLTGMWHSQDIAGRDAVHNGRWGVAPSVVAGLGTSTRLYLDYYHLVTDNIPDSGVPYNNPTSTVGALHDPGPRVLQPGDGQPLTLPNRRIFWGLVDRDKDKETAKIATGRVERDVFHEHGLLRNTFRYERTGQDYVWTLPDDSQGNIYYGLLFRRINSKMNAVFTDDNQTDLSGAFKTGTIRHTYATGMEFSKERGNVDSFTNNSTSFSITSKFPTATESCPTGAGAASGYNCVSLFTPNYNDPWTLTGTITKAHNPAHSKSVTQSAYAFDTIIFSSHFQSTLGVRYDHYDSTYVPAKSATAIAKQEVVNNIGTYLASLVYKPDRASSLYGSVSTAAVPTGNALAQGTDQSALSTVGNANLQPETIRQEEFGYKREVAHGKALARADIFRMDIQNVRITQADGTVAAAGNNTTLGAQVGLSGQVTRSWQFTGGYTYMDAVLKNAGFTTGLASASNNTSMPNTPRHSSSVTSSYLFFHKLRAGGGIYTMTKVWGSQANNKWVAGYARVDLFGNYEINKHLNLQANIQNLNDKLYYQQAYATHYAVMAPGRSAVFGINVKY
jgi:catecholate siderophore receptor